MWQGVVPAAWRPGSLLRCAPQYGLGLAERRLGVALDGRPRDELVISTKAGRVLRPAQPGWRPRRGMFDVPADYERVSINPRWSAAVMEASLQRSGSTESTFVRARSGRVLRGGARRGVPYAGELRTGGVRPTARA